MKNINFHTSTLPLLFFTLIISLFPIFNHAFVASTTSLTNSEVAYIKHRQLLYYRNKLNSAADEFLFVPSSFKFDNKRLRTAYIALQAFKMAIISDPNNLTTNWFGPHVCSYTGVFCASALDNPLLETVAGIDLNHGDLAGYLPEELGYLADVALIHFNSNRFCGTVPHSFRKLNLLYELDLSNNRFAGPFPHVVLEMPSLKYLDLRFNEFEGKVPEALFNKDLDAIFINNNRFSFALPENIGNSPVSVIVLANNMFNGCLPPSLGKMLGNVRELILMNNKFQACLPEEIGLLMNLTVLDVSNNNLMGELPKSITKMVNLEELNVAHNMLTGKIPEAMCDLPKLENFSYMDNFFTGEPPECSDPRTLDGRRNCLPDRRDQRAAFQCRATNNTEKKHSSRTKKKRESPQFCYDCSGKRFIETMSWS
ncbi:hypothetical protein ACFE04_018540 [Oxalis oulophora]